MSNVSSSFKTEVILLREALRRVVRRRGKIGEQVVERWDSGSFRELTSEDHHILHIDAKKIFAILRSGKLKATYSPEKNMLLEEIDVSVWNRCKIDNIHWHLSAIRIKPHDPMFEDIEVNAGDFERVILQNEGDVEACAAETEPSVLHMEVKNDGIYSKNKQKPRKPSKMQMFVKEIIQELSKEGIHIDNKTEFRFIYPLIVDRAEQKKKLNSLIQIPREDTVRRVLGRKK